MKQITRRTSNHANDKHCLSLVSDSVFAMLARNCKLTTTYLVCLFMLVFIDGGAGDEPTVLSSKKALSLQVKDDFIRAFRGENYAQALQIVDRRLKNDPENGLLLNNKAACLTLLSKHEQAVAVFRKAESLLPEDYADRFTLYLRAIALYQSRLYNRAQQMLDRLQKKFPQSRITQEGQQLAIDIEKMLSRKIDRAHLNWYMERGVETYRKGKPGITIEYLTEWQLLNQRLPELKTVMPLSGHIAMGGSFLEVFRPDKALPWLKNVPLAYGNYRVALMRAMAFRMTGKNREALDTLNTIIKETTAQDVRNRAERYHKKWQSNENN